MKDLQMVVTMGCPLELPIRAMFSEREMGLIAGSMSGLFNLLQEWSLIAVQPILVNKHLHSSLLSFTNLQHAWIACYLFLEYFEGNAPLNKSVLCDLMSPKQVYLKILYNNNSLTLNFHINIRVEFSLRHCPNNILKIFPDI